MRRERQYTFKLTLAEINALLATSGNADAHAMADDMETKAASDAFLAALQSAHDKLQRSK